MIFLIIMILGTLLIASAAVFFSVLGLVQTFSETAIYWGTSIEVAKLVLASFLYRFWDKTNIIVKTISMSLIALLMAITSLGIYGHIITSYQEGNLQVESQNIRLDTASGKLDRIQERIDNVNGQIERKQNRIDSIEADIARVPDNYVTVRRELIQERKPEMDRLENEIDELYDTRETLYEELESQNASVSDLQIETGEVENKAGPIMFVIEKLGGAGEQAIFWFVLIIVLSFDPAAVALTVYSNKVAVELRLSDGKLPESNPPDPDEDKEDEIIQNHSENNTSEPENDETYNMLSEVRDHLKKNEKAIQNQSEGLKEMRKHFDRERTKDDMIKDATR
jgi:archaellum component FlaC